MTRLPLIATIVPILQSLLITTASITVFLIISLMSMVSVKHANQVVHQISGKETVSTTSFLQQLKSLLNQ